MNDNRNIKHHLRVLAILLNVFFCSVVTAWTHTLGPSSSNDAVPLGEEASFKKTKKEIFYVHSDHLDTPRVITDKNGRRVWSWMNDDPFGGNSPNENPENQGIFEFNLRFPGQYYDFETNLFYNFNRYYDPHTGRYTQADRIGLGGGINVYRYAGNNPLINIDPTGEIIPFLVAPFVTSNTFAGLAGTFLFGASLGTLAKFASEPEKYLMKSDVYWPELLLAGLTSGIGTLIPAAFVARNIAFMGRELLFLPMNPWKLITAAGGLGGLTNLMDQYASSGKLCFSKALVNATLSALWAIIGRTGYNGSQPRIGHDHANEFASIIGSILSGAGNASEFDKIIMKKLGWCCDN